MRVTGGGAYLGRDFSASISSAVFSTYGLMASESLPSLTLSTRTWTSSPWLTTLTQAGRGNATRSAANASVTYAEYLESGSALTFSEYVSTADRLHAKKRYPRQQDPVLQEAINTAF